MELKASIKSLCLLEKDHLSNLKGNGDTVSLLSSGNGQSFTFLLKKNIKSGDFILIE
jgi:hypothetical protein